MARATTDLPLREVLSPAERRKVAALDVEIEAATVKLRELLAQRRKFMLRANTRRYLARRKRGEP